MKALYYTNIDIKRPKTEADSPIYARTSKIFSWLHYKIKNGTNLAIAFPEMLFSPGLGLQIRVFAENKEDIQNVQEYLWDTEQIPNFDYIATFNIAKSIYDNNIVGYECYSKFRIPCKKNSKKFANNDPEAQEKQNLLRQKRLAMAKSLPFVKVISKSTQRAFKLHIERKNCQPNLIGEPDGYGLSRKNNMMALPIFE